MVAKKRKTKRLTLKLKYKIQKKVRDHNKKLKKEKRKHPEKFRKKTKDPGVPKVLPFYEDIIQEAEAAKEARERRREEAKERRKEQKSQILEKKRNIGNITELLETAEQRGARYEEDQAAAAAAGDKTSLTDKSAKAYYREFRKVVEAADVILEVLDARDPQGTRVPQIESLVTGQSNKKLVLVLNKCDLIPRNNLEAWLGYLRREHAALPFKSSTQHQASNLAHISLKIAKSTESIMKTSQCLGADVLMQLLKNYCRNKNIKTKITVGVVGLPNVGKSSLINSLKRSKSCGVGSTPGFTKTLQEVQLDSKIQLLDCPGVILPGGDANDTTAALRNAVKVENLNDPFKPVEAIMKKADKNQLMIYYKLGRFDTTEQFLAQLAKRSGKLKKGGVPDREMAARKVLQDWNGGLIKYYTQPPETPAVEVGSSLVSELSKEFNLEELKEQEASVLAALPNYRPSQTMVVDSLGPVSQVRDSQEDMASEDEDGSEGMDEDDDSEEEEEQSQVLAGVQVNMDAQSSSQQNQEQSEKKPRWETELQEFDPTKMSLKKFQKKMQKKARKERNRNVRRTDELASAFEQFSGLKDKAEDYDFDVDFCK